MGGRRDGVQSQTVPEDRNRRKGGVKRFEPLSLVEHKKKYQSAVQRETQQENYVGKYRVNNVGNSMWRDAGPLGGTRYY